MDEPMPRGLKIDRQQDAVVHIGAPCAEIISRLWQAISFLEETRSDLSGKVRSSTSRDQAAIAITSGTQQLMLAAGILAPRVPKLEATPLIERPT